MKKTLIFTSVFRNSGLIPHPFKVGLLIKTLAVFIAFLLCAFTGCETTKGEEMLPFNATQDVGGPLAFREDFLKENRTYGVLFWNGNGDPWDIRNLEWDETSQKFRAFIITEKAQMDEIFSVYPAIDFEKDMVVMYAYTCIYMGRELKITSVTLDNKNLKIDFKIVAGKPGYKDASMPQTRFLVLRMDKLDIDTVEFTLLNP